MAIFKGLCREGGKRKTGPFNYSKLVDLKLRSHCAPLVAFHEKYQKPGDVTAIKAKSIKGPCSGLPRGTNLQVVYTAVHFCMVDHLARLKLEIKETTLETNEQIFNSLNFIFRLAL